MQLAKERVIYNNYDLWETYTDEDLMEEAVECGWIDEDDEINDSMLWDWRYDKANWDWEYAKNDISNFFKDKTVGFFGEVGRWNGVYKAGKIGEFWDLFWKATEDCDYIKIYDENGHMYLTCSHHDGTCHFEIKEITEKGKEYLENWEYNWNDNRSEEYCHNQIFKKYSHIPRYAEKEWGCKAREYEPATKANIIDKLNNSAKSFYC